MPSRLMSLLILVYWSIAAFCLLKWDVLPELSMGYPPDLRGITFASESNRPVRWSIQVMEGGPATENRRTVGEAVTVSTRQPNGWYEMTSRVDFDAGNLLRGTVLAMRESLRVEVKSVYHVDPSGNLRNFDLRVGSNDFGDELVHLTGRAARGEDGDRLAGSDTHPEHHVERSMSRGACSATSWGRSTGCRACMWASAGRCRSSTRFRSGRGGAGGGHRAEGDPLGRETRYRLSRWSTQMPSGLRADVGPHRRRDPPSGSAVPVRAADPGTSRRGRPRSRIGAGHVAGRPSS